MQCKEIIDIIGVRSRSVNDRLKQEPRQIATALSRVKLVRPVLYNVG